MDRAPGKQPFENEAAFTETIADAIVLATDRWELRVCQAAIRYLRRNVNQESLTEMVKLRAQELHVAI